MIGVDRPVVLDVGCGTGIATSQLHEKGVNVTGTDSDSQMIDAAKRQDANDIDYFVAPAEGQPFEDSLFDAVTAFSAFHWFTTQEAMKEIQRVLKPNGYFFVINKNEVGDFKKNHKKILSQFIQQEMPDAKKEYNPGAILSQYGFEDIKTRNFSVTEYYSPEEALGYIQTMSMWNLVPDEQKDAAKKYLDEHFQQCVDGDGKVVRELDVAVVSGRSHYK